MNRLYAALVALLVALPGSGRADYVITGAGWTQKVSGPVLQFKPLPTEFDFFGTKISVNVPTLSNSDDYPNGIPIDFYFTYTGTLPEGKVLPTQETPASAFLVVAFGTTAPATNDGGKISQPLTFGTIQVASNPDMFLGGSISGGPDLLYSEATWSTFGGVITGASINGDQGTLPNASLTIDGDASGVTTFSSRVAGLGGPTFTSTGKLTMGLPNLVNTLDSDVGLDLHSLSGDLLGMPLYDGLFLQDFVSEDPVTINFTPVPEPSSLILLGLTAAGGSFYGWRKRRNAAAA